MQLLDCCSSTACRLRILFCMTSDCETVDQSGSRPCWATWQMVDIFVQVHVGTCGECRRKEPRKRRLEVAPNRTVARAQTPCNGGRTPCRMLCSPTKRQQSNPLEFTNGTMPSTLTISSCNTRGRQILTAARHKTKLRYGLASALHHPAYGMGSICPVCFFFAFSGPPRNVLGHRISAAKICYTGLNTQLTIETLNVAFETCGHGSDERFPPQIWFWQLGKVLSFEMILHFGGCHWVDFVSWLNASQPMLKTEEAWGSWKIKNWSKLRHRDWILGQFFFFGSSLEQL